MDSTRWYWCTSSCGKWHDRTKPQEAHFLMMCPLVEPDERNFEGTADELLRFQTWRELQRLDREASREATEARIDEALPR